MSLKDQIKANYMDAAFLVAPSKTTGAVLNASGNGICYTGEFMVLLQKNKELDTDVETEFFHSTNDCMVEPGLLQRGPKWTGQGESVDDYYGFAAGCAVSDHQELAEMVIDYGWKHFGSFNDREPGKWTWASWLWRQPQLVFALYCAAGRHPRWYNPFSWWLYPLEAITVGVIATSCTFAPATNWDSRRLSWLLIQATTPVSFWCRLAAKIWTRRLYKTYPNGMKDVAAGYYQVGHPFISYWIT